MSSPVPCVPEGIERTADCRAGFIGATWNDANGAVSYEVTVTGPNGFLGTYYVTSPPLGVPGVPFGSQFGITVVSLGQCNSSSSQTTLIMTGSVATLSVDSF